MSASPSEAQAALALFDDVLERGSPPRWRVGAGAAIVLVLVAAAIAVAMAALRPSGAMTLPASTTSPPVAGAFGGAGASATPTAATILVHVLGAVRVPGVYELPAGSRLVDAVAAAGGLSDDADPSLVNLARTLVDGEQARIPRVGEPAPSEPAAGASGGGSTGGAGAGASGGSSGTASALVNLNTATQAELETLPRIGPAMAQRILDYRAQHGGYDEANFALDGGIGVRIGSRGHNPIIRRRGRFAYAARHGPPERRTRAPAPESARPPTAPRCR